MAVSVQDLAESVGLTLNDGEELTKEKFVEHVSNKYVPVETAAKDPKIISQVTGKRMGELTTKVSQLFGFKSSEVEGKKLEELLEGVSQKYSTEIETLRAEAGKGGDQKLQELTKTLQQKEAELQLKENGIKQLNEELEKQRDEFTGKMKSFKLEDRKGKVISSVADKFTDEFKTDKLKQAGFYAQFEQEYEFDLNDKDEPVLKSKKTGELVASKKVAGAVATPDEVLIEFAEANGILKKNNAPGGQKTPVLPKNTDGGNDGGKTVKVHPRAQMNANRV